MQWIKEHKLLTIVFAIVVAAGIWFSMSRGAPVQNASLVSTEVIDSGSPSVDSADRELVESLLTLRAITLSGTIFSDPAFKTLQDFGTSIVAEPVGRTNPFAPLRSAGPAPNSTQSPGATRSR